MTNRPFALIACLLALSFAVRAADDQQEEFDVVKRTDKLGTPPSSMIVQDNYVHVIMKRGATETKIPACFVGEVIYRDRDPNFSAGLEKREEGKYTLAAMYFTKALEAGTQKWAKEYCNYYIGDVLFQNGSYTGYKGKTYDYGPPSTYFKKALEANPKTRFLPDLVVRLPICLGEEGKIAEAEAALKDAEARIKAYKDETIKVGQGYSEVADRAYAYLAIADARLAEKKAGTDAKQWNDVKEKYLSARFKCAKYQELLVEAVDGVLRALIMMKDFNGAKAEADAIVDKYKKEGAKHLPLLPAAYTVLGKANLAQAVEYEGKGATIQARTSYAEARWAFLHVVAEFFDNDEYVASAHYFAGLCYDKLKEIESDAGEKAIRHWKTIIQNFPKSDIKPRAIESLQKAGVKVASNDPAPAPKKPAAAAAKPAADKKAPAAKK